MKRKKSGNTGLSLSLFHWWQGSSRHYERHFKAEKADNYCPHCTRGILPHSNVGFELHVGDIVEDHCGLRVRIDAVYSEDATVGWGTTLNAPILPVVGPNRHNHRVETDNDHYKESLWTKVS